MSNVTAIRKDLPAEPADDDRFLSPAQVAAMVPGLSVRTLREMRAANRELPWIQVSPKRVAYVEADVRAWVLARRTTVRTRVQS